MRNLEEILDETILENWDLLGCITKEDRIIFLKAMRKALNEYGNDIAKEIEEIFKKHNINF